MNTQAIIDAHLGGHQAPENMEFKKKIEDEKYKDRARRFTREAIHYGILTVQPCEECGDTNVQAHHEDYDKPLKVNWLCPLHHKKADIVRRNKLTL